MESSVPQPVNWRRELLIDSLYVAAIAINVAMVIDVATDGMLSKWVGQQVINLHGNWQQWNQARREYRHDVFEVFQQAHEAVKGEA